MRRKHALPLVLLLLLLTACQPLGFASKTAADDQPTLVLAGHDSFSISEEVLAAFEQEQNVRVQYLALGDAGAALNKIILSKDAPLADLFFGVDNTFLSRALGADIFVPYASPQLASIPSELQLDPENRLLPVDFGFVNFNADQGWFEAEGISLPSTLEDFADPAYKGLLVVQNPATSSPGLAFLLTTIAYFGEDGYLDYWRTLRDNDVLVTDGWSEAYFDHFTVGSGGGGDRPVVVSYSTSPPADVLYASDGRTEPASVNINPVNGTFRQIEFAGILAGSKEPELAQALIDFMLSRTFQEDVPLQMFVYPALSEAELPELFVAFAEVPEAPAELDPAAIEENREQWIAAWTEVMLR
jgi:thiamine transport system substrate-binding protein